MKVFFEKFCCCICLPFYLLKSYCSKKRDIVSHQKKLVKSIREHWKESQQEIWVEELIYEVWDGNKTSGMTSVENKETGCDDERKGFGNWIVFINDKLNVDWITEHDLTAEKSDHVSKAHAFESYPNEHLSRRHRIAYKNLIGMAIASSFEGSFETSEELLNQAECYLKKRVTEKSRSWVLTFSAAFITALLAIVYFLIQKIMVTTINFEILIAVLLGSVGAYLSIVQGAGTKQLDSSSGRWIHFIEVTNRFIIGGVSGAVGYAILKSPLCPSIFEGVRDSLYGIATLGFISGFSERFVPNMISKYESGTFEKEKK